jgi:lysozyme family protein
MTSQVNKILSTILDEEGGFTANPNDRAHYGKADPAKGRRWDCYCTNMGITQATLSDYYGRQATQDEVKNLSRDLARELYEIRYVSGPRFHTLPALIQHAMVDAGIHSGPRRAVTWLQRVLNAAGFGPVSTDGAIGPATRAAAERAAEAMGPVLVNALVEERRMFLQNLIDGDPSQKRFERGWMARLDRLEIEVA